MKKLLILAIVGLNICIFAYITYQNRYLAYGFDTVRELGNANRMRFLHALPDYSPERIGLPVFGALTSAIIGLPADQTLLIVLILTLFTNSFLWYTLFKGLSQHALLALTAVFLNLFLYPPGPLNAGSFFSLCLFPLRLIVLETLLKKRKPSIYFLYLILSLLSQFTYPILALATDNYILGYSLWLLTYRRYKPRFMLRILLSHLIALGAMYGFQRQITHLWLSPSAFFTQIYSLALTPLSISLISVIIVVIYALHLLYLPLALLTVKLGFNLAKITRLKLNSLLALENVRHLKSFFIWITIIIFLLPWFPLPLPAYLIANAFMLTGVGAALTLLISRTRASKITGYSWLLIAYILTMGGMLGLNFLSPGNYLLTENRFLLITQPWGTLIILLFFSTYKRAYIPIIILLILVSQLPHMAQFYRAYFSNPVDPDTITSSRFLNQLPNHTSVVFASPYFAQNKLTPHEKYESLYYTASTVPWVDQRRIGQCDPVEPECIRVVLKYAKDHRVQYVVIRNVSLLPTYYLYRQAGTVIYDGLIKIIKLYD